MRPDPDKKAKPTPTASASSTCPCDSGRRYDTCCGRFHAGTPAPTAVELMRSRYSAFVLGLHEYLRATWDADTCPADLADPEEPPRHWLGLEIKSCADTAPDHATVEFVARFKINGRAYRLHETSRFVRQDGRWRYVDGDIHER